MALSEFAASLGKGLLAGLAGTAAITLSQSLEMKLKGREPSNMPSKTAGRVLGVQPRHAEGRRRFNNIVHWGYGTSWGLARGVISAVGLREPLASVAHFVAVWGTAAVMLPSLDQTPPVTEWGARELASDLLHHAIYAAAAGAAFTYLDNH